ncbi:MAG: histidine kinase [Desulfobulbus propionicus]|nr:MAG: histidine kinase [Desulfobulbus propionicus]
MSIVTISRGSYSRGKEVAEAVASELGYECISREILVEASDQFNIPEIKLLKAVHDAPTVLERFNNGQQRYVAYFKSAFLSHMLKGNIVYHGLAGHFFLQNIAHALKVRIIADLNSRVAEEMRREGASQDSALFSLKKDDEERRKWSLHLHGKDPWDSRLYDMVLCVGSLTVDDVAELLVQVIQKEQFRETERSRAALQNLALQANIAAQVSKADSSAHVTLTKEHTVLLTAVDGVLKNDKNARKEFVATVKEMFAIEDVAFGEPVHPYKGHVNTFYNLDIE